MSLRPLVWVACSVAMLLVVGPAEAQRETAEPTPEAAAPADLARSEAPPAGGAGAGNVAEARDRVERGEALFSRGDYDAALTEFETAYRVIGEHPNRYLVLYNIGQCHEREFRYDVALEYYRRYLDEGGASAEDRAEVEGTIRTLEGLLATLNVETNVGAAVVWVDQREVGTAPGAVRIPAGVHVVEVRADGYLSARREVQVPAGGEARVRIPMEKLSEEFEGISPAFFFGAAGIGVAALATGIGFGLAAIGEHNGLRDRLDDPSARWDVTQDEIDAVSSLAVTADVFYATAALFGVGAIVVALLTDWDGDEEDGPDPSSSVTASVAVGPDSAAVNVVGSF